MKKKIPKATTKKQKLSAKKLKAYLAAKTDSTLTLQDVEAMLQQDILNEDQAAQLRALIEADEHGKEAQAQVSEG